MDSPITDAYKSEIVEILVKECFKSWEILAERLGSKEHEIESMKRNWKNDYDYRVPFNEMLRNFRKGGRGATYRVLITHLNQMDQITAAEKIEELVLPDSNIQHASTSETPKNTLTEREAYLAKEVPSESSSLLRIANVLSREYLRSDRERFFLAMGLIHMWEENRGTSVEVSYYNAIRAWINSNGSGATFGRLDAVLREMKWILIADEIYVKFKYNSSV